MAKVQELPPADKTLQITLSGKELELIRNALVVMRNVNYFTQQGKCEQLRGQCSTPQKDAAYELLKDTIGFD